MGGWVGGVRGGETNDAGSDTEERGGAASAMMQAKLGHANTVVINPSRPSPPLFSHPLN